MPKRPYRRALVSFVFAFAVLGGAVEVGAQSMTASVTVEANATDGDLKVLLSYAADVDIHRLVVCAPNGREILRLSGPAVPSRGVFEFEGEGRSHDTLIGDCPPGTYGFEALLEQGSCFVEAQLSYRVPSAPEVSPHRGAVIETQEARIQWLPVDGAVAYVVELEQGSLSQSWRVDSETRSVVVPAQFARGPMCSVDVAAVSANGNTCVVESSFYLAPERGAGVPSCAFDCTGVTPFFDLRPGFWSRLEAANGHRLEILTLNETEFVSGVMTRVVEEREFHGDQLVHRSRKFLAFCTRTADLYCFAEEIETYDAGVRVDQQRVERPEPWVFLPGDAARALPVVSTGFARRRVLGGRALVQLGSGKQVHVLIAVEQSAVAPFTWSAHYYAEGEGLVKRDGLEITVTGFIEVADEGDDEDD